MVTTGGWATRRRDRHVDRHGDSMFRLPISRTARVRPSPWRGLVLPRRWCRRLSATTAKVGAGASARTGAAASHPLPSGVGAVGGGQVQLQGLAPAVTRSAARLSRYLLVPAQPQAMQARPLLVHLAMAQAMQLVVLAVLAVLLVLLTMTTMRWLPGAGHQARRRQQVRRCLLVPTRSQTMQVRSLLVLLQLATTPARQPARQLVLPVLLIMTKMRWLPGAGHQTHRTWQQVHSTAVAGTVHTAGGSYVIILYYYA